MKLAASFVGVLLFAATALAQFDYSRVFAQLALGGGYEAVLLLTNKSTGIWTGHLRVRQGNNASWSGPLTVNGSAFPIEEGELFLQVAPRATIKLTLRGDQTVRSGYLEIHSTAGGITSNLSTAFFYNFYSPDGVLRSSTGSPESISSSRFVFEVEKSARTDTGFAWAPTMSESPVPSFPMTLTLYDANGNLFQTRTINFEGQGARFFSEVFTDLPATFVGHVVLQIPLPNLIYLTVLRMDTTGGGFQLTSSPPDALPPLVLPPTGGD